jgi:DNA-binding SARP family transcriptional activator
MCLLKKAHMDLTEGDHDEGLATLGQALNMGRHNDYVTLVWWWDPDMLSHLCAEAVCAGIEIDYVTRLIRIHRLRPRPQYLHLDQWPWPVSIRTFGGFQVQLQGTPLAFGKRAPKKPLELLQALIAFGGVDVPVQRLMDALWFDADGDMAHSAFSTALNRLRKLLREKQVIVASNGRLSLNLDRCWIDCLAFQQAIDAVNVCRNQGKKDEAGQLYDRAMSLYQAPFLSSEQPTAWIISARERLKKRFLAVALKMGQWLEGEHRYDAALACYQKGLAADDLEEALYQRLMSVQIDLSRYADAVRTYQRCKERLADVLGVAPSPATETLLRKARNSGHWGLKVLSPELDSQSLTAL